MPLLRRRTLPLCPLACALAACALAALPPPPAAAQGWRSKIDPRILRAEPRASDIEYLVLLREQADLAGAASQGSKEARGRFVFQRLREVADRTQPAVLAALSAHPVEVRPFWVANMIWVRGSREVAAQMAARPDVDRIFANVQISILAPRRQRLAQRAVAGIEWNVDRMGAPAYWDLGFTGEGVVIGARDTGYDWDHPALIRQYRGWDGSTADHDYNWYDAVHSGGGACGADSPEPCDDHGHGTVTLGPMVGDDGGMNRIGIAPGARWIGCRSLDEGVGSVASYSECFQFFLAPTDRAGRNADPSKAPHVVNNSWYCSWAEGCVDPASLRAVVENVRAAGIVVVAGAGNEGPDCRSISGPPGIYTGALTVGSTASNDFVTPSSSRGHAVQAGRRLLKPDVVAPGAGIRTSVRGGGYQSGWSGTSLASAHVSGQVALLLSARPALAGDVETLERCVRATALPHEANQSCGGIPAGEAPNNVYGHGRARLVWPLPAACDPPRKLTFRGVRLGVEPDPPGRPRRRP